MAKQRGAAADILLILLALVVLVLAMTGNASGLLSKLLGWLLGHPVLPIVTSNKKKNNNNKPSGGGTKQPATSKNTATKTAAEAAGAGALAAGAGGLAGALGRGVVPVEPFVVVP